MPSLPSLPRALGRAPPRSVQQVCSPQEVAITTLNVQQVRRLPVEVSAEECPIAFIPKYG